MKFSKNAVLFLKDVLKCHRIFWNFMIFKAQKFYGMLLFAMVWYSMFYGMLIFYGMIFKGT